MTEFKPTSEQDNITTLAKETKDNILVSALAGAAKTSTLVLIGKKLSSTMILSLAFNKKIADEMRERLPGNCTARTLNSIGHHAWSQHIMDRCSPNTRKTIDIMKVLVDNLPDGLDKKMIFDGFSEIRKSIAFAKACGYVPEIVEPVKGMPVVERLMDDSQYFDHHAPYEHSDMEIDFIIDVLRTSIQQSHRGVIDFDDQIYMPTLFGASFQKYHTVMVDEAQDLSAINHVMLHKLVGKRLIAVGDPCQAIYGFRGAHEDSMEKLQAEFDMVTADLTVSFRCPISVVEHARWRAPKMQYPDWATQGEIRDLRERDWTVDIIPDGAAIICRNNAPLYGLAIELLKAGRTPTMAGQDFIGPIIKILKKFGNVNDASEVIEKEVMQWRNAKLKRDRDSSNVKDQADCMMLFLSTGDTLGDAITYAEHLQMCEGPLQLMTGHKSKGLEFDDVFILDRHLIRLDEPGSQDRNLLYVMQTRAMRTLTYIDSERLMVT